MQSETTPFASALQDILQEISNRGTGIGETDAFMEKELIGRLEVSEMTAERLLSEVQKLIDTAVLQSPNKYIALIYASLLAVGSQRRLTLFNFYYKLASQALKELKQTKKKQEQLWQIFLEKLYHFGMLLLTGNRTLLLPMQSLGTRVNSQLLANSARELKLSKLVRIYNCILCIPETYMTLKQTLSLTLVFTSWSLSENDAFTHSFFAAFQKKTQRKLIKKLWKYPKQQFIEEHLLNLIKIVMCGEEMLFSYFLQAKVAYECSKHENIMGREKLALEGLKGAVLLKEGKRLFNLVVRLLFQARRGPLDQAKREAVLVITLRFLSPKFENNEGLFNVLVDNYLYEQNPAIIQIAGRIIREEALSYITVYKVKLLLNLFNINSWGALVKAGIAQEVVIDRLSKINTLLMALAHRYSNSNVSLKCLPDKCALAVENCKEVRSLTFLIIFTEVGKIAEPQSLNGSLFKIKLEGNTYQLKISFSELPDSLSIQSKPEQKQRQGKVAITCGKKELISEAKQFIRYRQGNYGSLVTVSLAGKQGRKLSICVDGSFYELELGRKSQIKSFQLGQIRGVIQSFHALNIEISPVQFYKTWSEYERKTNFVIESLGKDKICYQLTNKQQQPIHYIPDKGWSLFRQKTEISVRQAVKRPLLLDIFLQLGGLQTMFFILQRLSRTLLQFQGSGERIVQLLGEFFEMLKLTAYLDESYNFLNQVAKCFKYINPFMFLLIKRNRILRETQDSRLLLSLFQMIIYFRKAKPASCVPPQMQRKMAAVEVRFVVQTLCNFQIWSNCSMPLQSFVLSLVEAFIKNENCLKELIEVDILKELLGTLVLFGTSQAHLACAAQLQLKLIQLCALFYGQIQNQFTTLAAIRQLPVPKNKQACDNFVERDLLSSLALLKALGCKGVTRQLSQSERSGFQTILLFTSKTFIESAYIKIIGKDWFLFFSVLCDLTKKMLGLTRQLLSGLADIILVYVSKQISNDGWILAFLRSCAENRAISIVDCLCLLHFIAQKYSFTSPGKSIIIQRAIELLEVKAGQTNSKEELELAKDFVNYSKSVSVVGLFRLSSKKQYFRLCQRIKRTYFQARESVALWSSFSYNFLMSLCEFNKITQSNATFVRYLLENVYLQNPEHPLAFQKHLNSTIRIYQLKELAKQQKSASFQGKASFGTDGFYSLLQHCRGWLCLYFLHGQGLLNGKGDLSIPFLVGSIETGSAPGGIIPFYLSGKCDLQQLYFLLNIIIYRQLINKVSYLTTLAPVVIYQKTIQIIIEAVNKNAINELPLVLVVLLLKEVLNSLNNGYVVKTGTVCRDIQKLLGSVGAEGYHRKEAATAEALARASNRVQLALEESKTDKQLYHFLELVLFSVNKIVEGESNDQMAKMLASMVYQIKKLSQSTLQKLKMVGLRFFQVSKEYWVLRKQVCQAAQPISQRLAQIVLRENPSLQKALQEKYQNLLLEYTQKGIQSEKNWQNLLISNMYWFQLQSDLSDLTTKFYELDQKEIGPFGFYKLGIRPVRTHLDKLPFPRRQEYKDLIVKKEQESQRHLAPRQTIFNSKSTFFTEVAESNRPQSVARSLTTESVLGQRQKKLNNEYWCEWVTKRGVYAGKLRKVNKAIEFTFTGHSKLPPQREYQLSTNRCHWIQELSEWEQREFGNAVIPTLGSEIFSRRYILRHTAFEMFNPNTHRSYFFNLFFIKPLQSFLSEFRSGEAELIINRPEEFSKRGITEKWQKGEMTNFEYLCLVNRYSGRTTNDLAQYPVLPWVVVNFNASQGYTQLNQKYLNDPNNMRDLTKPTGKLGEQKFGKLKSRLQQIDPADKQIRFLYGTMYSNPTVLYNFFIRLQPYTSLHWAHQSGKLDHADRLFSGIHQQFITIITSSSDMKELAPEFYYWPEFLRNRNRIQLGRKQKGEEVDSVVLPPWARNPEEFVFKMREVLQSPQVTAKLHNWIDLIFGYKSPYQVAEQHDNLYHFQCYEQDIFTAYESQGEMRTAQIAISEFGQVGEQVFFDQHPRRNIRKEMSLDTAVVIAKAERNAPVKGYMYNQAGLMLYTPTQVLFKKAAIAGFYNNFEWHRDFECHAQALFLDSLYSNRWIALHQGRVRLHERKKVKAEFQTQSRCVESMGDYLFFAVGSKIVIVKIVNDGFQEMTQLFGHHSEVILIRTEPSLDLLVSIDRSGLVLVHELIQLRFLRAFHLGTEFDGEEYLKLKCCIHRMGYFIFFDHQQTLYVYNYLGEQLLEQEMLIKSEDKGDRSQREQKGQESERPEESITDVQLFSHDAFIILASSSRGNIYSFNLLQIMRFRQVYPYKNYGREIRNLLCAIPRRREHSIVQFSMVRGRGTSNLIYQILALYEDGELLCFSENFQMGKQLQENTRLKAMGFV